MVWLSDKHILIQLKFEHPIFGGYLIDSFQRTLDDYNQSKKDGFIRWRGREILIDTADLVYARLALVYAKLEQPYMNGYE